MLEQTHTLSFHSRRDLFWGPIFVTFSLISFCGFFCVAILSKFLPESSNRMFNAIQNDRYYFLLVPLTIPVLVVAVYFHWLSLKFFKHA